MAVVKITPSLEGEINKRFKAESIEVLSFLKTLETSPKKGTELGTIGGIVSKEIRYGGYRFYFITDGYKVKFFKADELTDLLIKFVRMSDKNHQQQVINEIKHILRTIGKEGFEK